MFTETWYWDRTDATAPGPSAWERKRRQNAQHEHAGVYAGTMHYLKAVAALKSAADGKAVVAEMKKMPTDDPLFGKGTIRADGRKLHPAYLFEVKKPSESKSATSTFARKIPANEAFRPLKAWQLPAGQRLTRNSPVRSFPRADRWPK